MGAGSPHGSYRNRRGFQLGATTEIAKTITTNPDLNRGLVGHWTFDNKYLRDNVVDRSGSGNTGIIEGQDTATTTRPGVIGQALEWATEDKIIFGLDWPGVDMQKCVDYMKTFEIPEELQQQYGYQNITDETRAKILGLNLANLIDLDTTKRVPAANGA